MCDPDVQPVGSGICKVGWSGDDQPRACFPTVVGRQKNPGIGGMGPVHFKDCYVGDEAIAKKGILRLKYPIQHGNIMNFNDYEKVLHHSFYNELRMSPEEHPVFLTEKPLNDKREKIVNLLFEKFLCPSLYLCVDATCALLSSGIDNGSHIPRAVIKSNLGGNSVLEYFKKYINDDERGDFYSDYQRETVRSMKEKHCFVATRDFSYKQRVKMLHINDRLKGGKKEYTYNVLSYLDCFKQYRPLLGKFPIEIVNEIFSFQKINKSVEKIKYTLRDGSTIFLEDELYASPEVMFKPSLFGSELPGIDEQCFNSIMKIGDKKIRNIFFENILLCGGNTMFEGFEQRISDELKKLAPKNQKIKVKAPAERKYNAWIGGSILSSLLSSLPSFENCWVTKRI